LLCVLCVLFMLTDYVMTMTIMTSGVIFVAAKPPKFTHDIISGMPKVIKVKAGQPLNVRLPFSGTPRPTIDWTQDGSRLKPHQKTRISELQACFSRYLCHSFKTGC